MSCVRIAHYLSPIPRKDLRRGPVRGRDGHVPVESVVSPSYLALAACLLTAPAGTPELPPADEQWLAVTTALVDVAVAWEIFDPQERPYFFFERGRYQSELDTLRQRRADLADAPPVAEAVGFPRREIVHEYLRFNRAYRQELVGRIPWEEDRADLIRRAIREADDLYRVWDAVRDARSEFYQVTYRRQALKTVRDLIGPAAYAARDLPPYVPAWRFAERRLSGP